MLSSDRELGQSVFVEPEAISQDQQNNQQAMFNGQTMLIQPPSNGHETFMEQIQGVAFSPYAAQRGSVGDASDSSQQGVFAGPAHSPAFSQASSPYSVQSQFISPAPSPQQFVSRPNDAFSPPCSQIYTNTASAAPSPSTVAASPAEHQQQQHQAYMPQAATQMVVTEAAAALMQHAPAGLDVAVNQMKEMNVSGRLAPPHPSLLQSLSLQRIQNNTTVDIGHPCPPESSKYIFSNTISVC